MIVDSAEPPALEVTVVAGNLEPGTTSRMQEGISPCIEVDFNGIWSRGVGINIGINTDVRLFVDIQRCDANRKAGLGGGGQFNRTGILQLGWLEGLHFQGIKGFTGCLHSVLEHIANWITLCLLLDVFVLVD
jgi:hypothetical protein